MWKWLRSWFAWRFSLVRLVVAVVFLGAFVGLNMQKIGPVSVGGPVSYYWGWPLPFIAEADKYDLFVRGYEAFCRAEGAEPGKAGYHLRRKAASYEYPWTHQTYTFSRLPVSRGLQTRLIIHGVFDALVGLVPLALILFFHPRRKPPDEAPA